MRKIVLSVLTEPHPETGEPRIIEIGAVELENGVPSGREFHAYIDPGFTPDPDTHPHWASAEVHPHIRAIAGELRDFLDGAWLIHFDPEPARQQGPFAQLQRALADAGCAAPVPHQVENCHWLARSVIRGYQGLASLLDNLDVALDRHRQDGRPHGLAAARLTHEIWLKLNQIGEASARLGLSALKEPALNPAITRRRHEVVLNTVTMPDPNGGPDHIIEVAAVALTNSRPAVGPDGKPLVFHAKVRPEIAIGNADVTAHPTLAELLSRPRFTEIADGLARFVGTTPILLHEDEAGLKSGPLAQLNRALARIGKPALDTARPVNSMDWARQLFPADVAEDRGSVIKALGFEPAKYISQWGKALGGAFVTAVVATNLRSLWTRANRPPSPPAAPKVRPPDWSL